MEINEGKSDYIILSSTLFKKNEFYFNFASSGTTHLLILTTATLTIFEK